MTTGELTELKMAIAQARQDLLDMLLYEDRQGPKNQQAVNDSAYMVNLHLMKITVNSRQESTLNELKSTWKSFKATRESEILPALLAGDIKKAQHLAAGIQKERLNKIYRLIRELENTA